jgi:nucleoside-diphosphate-sugar epimerase
VGDASGGAASAQIHDEEHLPEPTKDKAARVAIDQLVLAAAAQNVRSAVLCNTLIYGHGLGLARDSVQIPRLVAQARKNGVVRHVGAGRNIWSNVHIADVAQAYRLALEKTPAGTFYFIESGEAAYRELTTAIAKALNLPGPQDWPLEDAIKEWGYEMASYALGSNSRVRGKRAPALLGWKPTHGRSAPEWILRELV